MDLSHIHNKMLFDSVNEILDNYRLYGLNGEKYPHKILYAKSQHIKDPNLMCLFVKCLDQIMEWNTYMCGFHKDKEDSFLQLPIALDDEIVEQIKEDRMVKLVTKEILDFEVKLAEIDEEEYDVLFDISDRVFDVLLDDLIGFMNSDVN